MKKDRTAAGSKMNHFPDATKMVEDEAKPNRCKIVFECTDWNNRSCALNTTGKQCKYNSDYRCSCQSTVAAVNAATIYLQKATGKVVKLAEKED